MGNVPVYEGAIQKRKEGWYLRNGEGWDGPLTTDQLAKVISKAITPKANEVIAKSRAAKKSIVDM